MSRPPELIVVGTGTSARKFLASAVEHRLTDRYRIRALDEHAEGSWQSEGHRALAERDTVLAVDPARHVVKTASGRTLEYDVLVLATGRRMVVPKDLNAPPSGCFVYRASGELAAIRREARHCRRGVVLGGGRHGLQAAQMLRELGLETHIVEQASRLLPAWVDEAGGIVLQSRIAKLGVEVHLGLALQDILSTDGRVSSVRFTDGSEIAADLVISCPAARARDELGRASGLKLADRDGIAVDERCRTSDPDVFALGSVASYQGHCLNWTAAKDVAARTAASTLAGEPVSLRSLEVHASFRVLGVDVASFGDAFARSRDSAEISIFDAVADTYARLAVGENGTKLLGGMLVGNVTHYPELLSRYTRGLPLPAEPGFLLRLLTAGPASLSPASVRVGSVRRFRKTEALSARHSAQAR